MRKIIIFGNAGSGKSTLSAALCASDGLAHLDLDTLAWFPTEPPQRRPLQESKVEILQFIREHEGWVAEGCYADLLALVKPFATEAVFMNLPVYLCQENARNRPWEPHKYRTKEAQDENLAMLLDWIAGYDDRKDVLSYQAHRSFYESFQGKKMEIIRHE